MKKAKVAVIGILTGLAVIYIGFGIFFLNHFCFGTTINGIDVGGKTSKQVEALIEEEIKGYELQLIEREEETETISGSSFFIEPVFNGEVDALLKEQQAFAWGITLFRHQDLSLEKVVSYDKGTLEELLDNLNATQKSNEREPVNASCSEYTKDGYELVPADYGTTLDKEKLLQAACEAVTALEDSLDLDEAGCYVEPEIGDDNKALLSMIEEMNHYVNTTITYDFDPETEIVDGSVISGWLTADEEKFKAILDTDAVASYVKELAATYNTVYKPKKLMTSYGTEVTISTGHYGWKIDQAAETEQLIADLEDGKDVKREPVYAQRANSHGENDYGDSYVEINLTAQHLFLYKDGKLVTESDLVSGCVAKGNATPTGAFPLTYKTKDAVLRGDDYATPVSYWMPFNGNIGMHDLQSRKAFGGDIYLYHGSHGCINLPLSAAKTIYETIEQGYPVLVYELPGTQSEAVKQAAASSVIAAIDAIGPTVTLDSAAAIAQARALYDSLDSATKPYVTNYQNLLNAEAVLAQLMASQVPAEGTPQ